MTKKNKKNSWRQKKKKKFLMKKKKKKYIREKVGKIKEEKYQGKILGKNL